MRWTAIMAAALSGLLWAAAAAASNDSQSDDARGVAILAGGCFWCVEADFDKVPGVTATVSGFTGGHVADPSYQQVVTKTTGHQEAVRIEFDPAKVTYEEILTAYWRSIDPTDKGGQFCDRGEPYETAVFVLGPEQRAVAEKTKAEAEKDLGQSIVTPIKDAAAFYPAEEYHQDYYNKNSLSYKFYRWRCGRDERVRELWGEAAYTGIPGH